MAVVGLSRWRGSSSSRLDLGPGLSPGESGELPPVPPFSQREKVPAKRADEGLRTETIVHAPSPHPSPSATPSPYGRGLLQAYPIVLAAVFRSEASKSLSLDQEGAGRLRSTSIVVLSGASSSAPRGSYEIQFAHSSFPCRLEPMRPAEDGRPAKRHPAGARAPGGPFRIRRVVSLRDLWLGAARSSP